MARNKQKITRKDGTTQNYWVGSEVDAPSTMKRPLNPVINDVDTTAEPEASQVAGAWRAWQEKNLPDAVPVPVDKNKAQEMLRGSHLYMTRNKDKREPYLRAVQHEGKQPIQIEGRNGPEIALPGDYLCEDITETHRMEPTFLRVVHKDEFEKQFRDTKLHEIMNQREDHRGEPITERQAIDNALFWLDRNAWILLDTEEDNGWGKDG